jgi:hypothetical protein
MPTKVINLVGCEKKAGKNDDIPAVFEPYIIEISLPIIRKKHPHKNYRFIFVRTKM